MGKIVISTNVSLDGVVQDPDGKEGSTLGGWFTRSGGRDLEQWAKIEFEEAFRAEALLWAGGATSGSRPAGGHAGPGSGRSSLAGYPQVRRVLDHRPAPLEQRDRQ